MPLLNTLDSVLLIVPLSGEDWFTANRFILLYFQFSLFHFISLFPSLPPIIAKPPSHPRYLVAWLSFEWALLPLPDINDSIESITCQALFSANNSESDLHKSIFIDILFDQANSFILSCISSVVRIIIVAMIAMVSWYLNCVKYLFPPQNPRRKFDSVTVDSD